LVLSIPLQSVHFLCLLLLVNLYKIRLVCHSNLWNLLSLCQLVNVKQIRDKNNSYMHSNLWNLLSLCQLVNVKQIRDKNNSYMHT